MTSRIIGRRAARSFGGAVAAAVLAACTTPYQPAGMGGGFTDRLMSDGRIWVEFTGNGNTPRDLVANMYLYRCAELTAQKGFDVFRSMSPETAAASRGWAVAPSTTTLLAQRADDAPDLHEVKSGAAATRTVPIYVPSAPVTIHTVKGVVQMGRYADVPANVRVWDARTVMKTLEPIVKGKTGARALRAEDIASTAIVNGRGRAQAAGGTSLDDLQRLLQQAGDQP